MNTLEAFENVQKIIKNNRWENSLMLSSKISKCRVFQCWPNMKYLTLTNSPKLMYDSTAFKFVPIDGWLINYVVLSNLKKKHKEKVVWKKHKTCSATGFHGDFSPLDNEVWTIFNLLKEDFQKSWKSAAVPFPSKPSEICVRLLYWWRKG